MNQNYTQKSAVNLQIMQRLFYFANKIQFFFLQFITFFELSFKFLLLQVLLQFH